jgi:hypothetical protein
LLMIELDYKPRQNGGQVMGSLTGS